MVHISLELWKRNNIYVGPENCAMWKESIPFSRLINRNVGLSRVKCTETCTTHFSKWRRCDPKHVDENIYFIDATTSTSTERSLGVLKSSCIPHPHWKTAYFPSSLPPILLEHLHTRTPALAAVHVNTVSTCELSNSLMLCWFCMYRYPWPWWESVNNSG